MKKWSISILSIAILCSLFLQIPFTTHTPVQETVQTDNRQHITLPKEVYSSALLPIVPFEGINENEIKVETIKTNASLETKPNTNILTDFDPNATNVYSMGEFKLTAYCPCTKCCGKWGSDRPTNDKGETLVKTASGKYAYANHTIAVDPKLIPYGTIVIIERNGKYYKYVAEDCGGSIKNNRIDVFHNNHQIANDFGVKYGNVYVLYNQDLIVI